MAMKALGYDTQDLPATIKAFHRHYRGIESNTLDSEDAKILFDLQKSSTPV